MYAIHTFLSRGGVLLLMGDCLIDSERASALTTGFSIRFSRDLVGDVVVSGKAWCCIQ